uniref:Uncharacterized protein n=1 Tax=Armadillidium vulgare clopovirus TaxID=2984284 RepID=A0A9C7C758_9VIRU|nr:MAG: hypothetical protein [Armadillidium vulgare clopovirus]
MFKPLPAGASNIIFKESSFQDVFNFYIAPTTTDRVLKNSANYYLQRELLFDKEKGVLDFDLIFPLIDVGRNDDDNATMTAAEVFSIYSNFVREGTEIFSEFPIRERPRSIKLTLSKYGAVEEEEEEEEEEGRAETLLLPLLLFNGVEILQNLHRTAYYTYTNTLIISMDDYKPFIKMMREFEKQERPLTSIEVLDIRKTNNNRNHNSNNNNNDDGGDDFNKDDDGDDGDDDDFIEIMKGVLKIFPNLRDIKIHCKCKLYHRTFYNNTRCIAAAAAADLYNTDGDNNNRCLCVSCLNRRSHSHRRRRSLSQSLHRSPQSQRWPSFSNLKALYVDINDIETLMKFPSSSSSSSSSQSVEKIGIRLNHYHFASTVIDSDQLISLVSEVFDKVRTIELNINFAWEEEEIFPAFLSLPKIIRKCEKFPWKCGSSSGGDKKDCSNKNLDTLIIAVEIDGKRVREWTFKEKKKKKKKKKKEEEDINNEGEKYDYYRTPDFNCLKDFTQGLCTTLTANTTLEKNKLEMEVPVCLLCYMIPAAIEIVWHYFFSEMRDCSKCLCAHRNTPFERDIHDLRDVMAFRKQFLLETNKGKDNKNGSDGGRRRRQRLFEFRIPSSCALNSILSKNMNFEKKNDNNNNNISIINILSEAAGRGFSSSSSSSCSSDSFQFKEVRNLKLIFDLSYMKNRPPNDICECVHTGKSLPLTFHKFSHSGSTFACWKESPTIYSFCHCNFIDARIPKTFPNLERLEIRRENCPPLNYKNFFVDGEEEERDKIMRLILKRGGIGFEKLRELEMDYLYLTPTRQFAPSLEKATISFVDDIVDITDTCSFLTENPSLKCIEFNFDYYLQNRKAFRIQNRNYYCCRADDVGFHNNNNRSFDILVTVKDDDDDERGGNFLIYWDIRIEKNYSEYIRLKGKIIEDDNKGEDYNFYNREALSDYLENSSNPLLKTFDIFCPYFNQHNFILEIFDALESKVRDKITSLR